VAISIGSILVDKAYTSEMDVLSTPHATEGTLLQLGMSASAAEKAVQHSSTLFDRNENSDMLPTLHIVSKRLFPRISVDMEVEALAPNPGFVADIDKVFALSSKDTQIAGLKDVLRRWGSVVATHVDLGCSLVAANSIKLPYITPEVSS
jgi:hypothetical protein